MCGEREREREMYIQKLQVGGAAQTKLHAMGAAASSPRCHVAVTPKSTSKKMKTRRKERVTREGLRGLRESELGCRFVWGFP